MALKSNKQVVRRWKEPSPRFAEVVDEWLVAQNWESLGPSPELAAYDWVLSKPEELRHLITVRPGASYDPLVRVTTTAEIRSQFVASVLLQTGFYSAMGLNIDPMETNIGAQVLLVHANDLLEYGSIESQYAENITIDSNNVVEAAKRWTKTFELIDRRFFANTQSAEQVARWIDRHLTIGIKKNPMSQIGADAVKASVLYAQSHCYEDSLRLLEFSRGERVSKFQEVGFSDWADRTNKAMDGLKSWIIKKQEGNVRVRHD